MIGLLVASHGDLAKALVESAFMLVGETEQVISAGLYPGDSPDAFYARLASCAEKVDTGDGVAAIVDVFGGTPCNTTVRLARERNIRIVTGANMPMMLYACTERTEDTTLQEMVEGLVAAGSEGCCEFEVPAMK